MGGEVLSPRVYEIVDLCLNWVLFVQQWAAHSLGSTQRCHISALIPHIPSNLL